jgi:hypothetical protein
MAGKRMAEGRIGEVSRSQIVQSLVGQCKGFGFYSKSNRRLGVMEHTIIYNPNYTGSRDRRITV